MRSYWRGRVLNLTTGILIWKEDTCPYKEGEGHVTKAEIRLMRPQAKECLRPPEAGRGGRILPRDFREGMVMLLHWFQISGCQNCERIHFCCFKSCSIYYNSLGEPRQSLSPAFLFRGHPKLILTLSLLVLFSLSWTVLPPPQSLRMTWAFQSLSRRSGVGICPDHTCPCQLLLAGNIVHPSAQCRHSVLLYWAAASLPPLEYKLHDGKPLSRQSPRSSPGPFRCLLHSLCLRNVFWVFVVTQTTGRFSLLCSNKAALL